MFVRYGKDCQGHVNSIAIRDSLIVLRTLQTKSTYRLRESCFWPVVSLCQLAVRIVRCYVPNSGDGLKRLGERVEKWDVQLRERLETLAKKKHVLLMGDLNVAHQDKDSRMPLENLWNILKNGFHDSQWKSLVEFHTDLYQSSPGLLWYHITVPRSLLFLPCQGHLEYGSTARPQECRHHSRRAGILWQTAGQRLQGRAKQLLMAWWPQSARIVSACDTLRRPGKWESIGSLKMAKFSLNLQGWHLHQQKFQVDPNTIHRQSSTSTHNSLLYSACGNGSWNWNPSTLMQFVSGNGCFHLLECARWEPQGQ